MLATGENPLGLCPTFLAFNKGKKNFKTLFFIKAFLSSFDFSYDSSGQFHGFIELQFVIQEIFKFGFSLKGTVIIQGKVGRFELCSEILENKNLKC